MSVTYVVLGSARSGTSLAAGVLSRLGVQVDYSIAAPDFYAPKGYYESRASAEINQKIYKLAWRGRRQYPDNPVAAYWNPPPWEDVCQQGPAVADDIRALVAQHAAFPAWGFKNPATCLTLGLYLPHLENPRFVLTHRDMEENVAACSLIYKLDPVYIHNVLCMYQDRLQQTLAGCDGPQIVVDYAEFKDDHQAVAGRLAEFCDTELTPERREAMDQFVVKRQFGLAKYRTNVA
ncbi:MAG: sulfotransferase [Pirellulales bacterium]|nr:sulfotransferase [Pirellulales bacterium]